MAEILLFGVPHGQDISKTPNSDARNVLESFYDGRFTGVKTKTIRRPNNDVHYVFVIYEEPGKNFNDYNGRPGSHFGISLIFNNQYSTNPDKIFKLLQTVYDDYIKNKIIQEFPNGNKKWLYPAISNEIDTYVVKCLQYVLKTKPELNIWSDLQPLPPIQKQTER